MPLYDVPPRMDAPRARGVRERLLRMRRTVLGALRPRAAVPGVRSSWSSYAASGSAGRGNAIPPDGELVIPRVLTCVDCETEVEVFELPVRFIDPRRFRCIPCLDPRHAEPQLELQILPAAARSERRAYDPRQAAIPF